ncbi:MAG TPA: hypothetical protein VL995_01350 [Cellvibrio sp.]|nr:hypothetical protein [Cellvibrio sp.]
MDQAVVETLEINLLVDAIFQYVGRDYRYHRQDFLRQKLFSFMKVNSIATISGLQEKIFHESDIINSLLCCIDSRPVKLFDQPEKIMHFRRLMVPWLRSFPAANFWIADCIAPEDIFGWIILLMEENLYCKTQLYVTSPNIHFLAAAKSGQWPSELFEQYEHNYRLAGGSRSLSYYCSRIKDTFVFNPELGNNVYWSQYPLIGGASFNEYEVIVCCGGLSHLNARGRDRALSLFYNSQPAFGLLAVQKASALTEPIESFYKIISNEAGIYQRKHRTIEP